MPIISSVSGNVGPIGRSRKPFNLATGGNSVADIANYNGTGQLWRVHTFTSAGSLQVISNLDNFTLLIVGGGGPGGVAVGGYVGGGGGGGGVYLSSTQEIQLGTRSVTVGSGGLKGSWNGVEGNVQGRTAGGTSSFNTGTVNIVCGGGGSGSSGPDGGGSTGPTSGSNGGGNGYGGGIGSGPGRSAANGSGANLTYLTDTYSVPAGPSGNFGNAPAIGGGDGYPGVVKIAYRIG